MILLGVLENDSDMEHRGPEASKAWNVNFDVVHLVFKTTWELSRTLAYQIKLSSIIQTKSLVAG